MADSHQSAQSLPDGVQIHGPQKDRDFEVLTPQALAFVAELHRRFDERRVELLSARARRQQEWDDGALPGFLKETRKVREDDKWQVASIPEGLQDRRVEITGPVERKMMINALNSGAKVFMADFEDSNSPTWRNNVEGQINLSDYTNGRLEFKDPKKGKEYRVGEDPATLVVRLRGLHLPEDHVTVDGQSVSGAFFDFAVHFQNNARRLHEQGRGPWYYVPKLEDYKEARLWDEVFAFAERSLGLEPGTIKVTCLIETFPAVFQMDEILYELKDHMAGLNAGRWDYIFSCIKVCRNHADKILPDRGQVTMTVPFMRAYTELLVRTCHKRGAFAMGGMSAFIPDRKDPEVTKKALEAVRADKKREAGDGCDGTWVAHPDLVEVAMEIFDEALGDKPNQLGVQREDVDVDESGLQDFTVPGAQVTHGGLKANLDVALRYLEAWLGGAGAAAIHNLMEDAATAEIARSQVWQWIHHAVPLEDGTPVTRGLVESLINDLLKDLSSKGDDHRYDDAARLLREVALVEQFPDFLTLPAYPVLTQETRP